MSVASISQKQAFFMSKALEASSKARMIAPPNPWVGCVIVKYGEIIAEGHTQAYGGDHAEIQALKIAKEKAIDSTVYVTLEPCPMHGRTPPCTEALIQAGVQKVVIGILDPDPNVCGKGVAKLQEAGIEVEIGILKEEVTAVLKPYLHHRETRLPYCVLKAAISMDGKIAAKNGTSIWITGKEARADVHKMRARSQAILVGTNTVLEDHPRLTVRLEDFTSFQPPLRVIVDTTGKVEPKGDLFDTSLAPTLVLTTKAALPDRVKAWRDHGCEVEFLELASDGQGINLKQALVVLGQKGVLQLMVEGGSQLFSSLIKENLVNKLVLYMGACLLGAEGVSLFSKLKLESIDDAIRMHLNQMLRLGKDIRLDYTF
ncbi:MAG: Riboflavin biosynthesis protein RibD [Chlamydiae bacterium]|nr:Riboflavin biosynthesis protein RibD [Chlamydiota bacterium]